MPPGEGLPAPPRRSPGTAAQSSLEFVQQQQCSPVSSCRGTVQDGDVREQEVQEMIRTPPRLTFRMSLWHPLSSTNPRRNPRTQLIFLVKIRPKRQKTRNFTQKPSYTSISHLHHQLESYNIPAINCNGRIDSAEAYPVTQKKQNRQPQARPTPARRPTPTNSAAPFFTTTKRRLGPVRSDHIGDYTPYEVKTKTSRSISRLRTSPHKIYEHIIPRTIIASFSGSRHFPLRAVHPPPGVTL